METKLVDYTKFRLKPAEEIHEVFNGVGRIFILSCAKCYQRFEQEAGEEYAELLNQLGEDKDKIFGHAQIDFLCNSFLSEKTIYRLDISGCDAVGVISCGLGVQFVAELIEGKPVYTLADSMPQSGNPTSGVGYHGVSLEQEQCAACGQCYLNLTGGICPVIDCAKGLLNGPCGGARDGKCEVDSNIDCAWTKIYERRKNRREPLALEVVQFHDYSKPDIRLKSNLAQLNQKLRGEGFYGGVHPLEGKQQTEHLSIKDFPGPERAIIFLSQHTGRKANLLVKQGDMVRVGQIIAEANGFISSNIHSSVSGKVVSIEERIHPVFQKREMAVIIKNDRKNILDSSIKSNIDFENLSREELLDIIKGSGIVGLGGAMFPTQVKLAPLKKVDTLLVNGCECEPYLNSDSRIMIEHPQELLIGIALVRKILGVGRVIVGVENNKPEAITRLGDALIGSSVEMVCLNTKYPQGAERMLIKKVLGREVPRGGLPFDVGVMVSNIGTILAIYQAVVQGIPLFQRIITVSGENARRQGNYRVRIGTPFKDIVEYCFAVDEADIFEEYELKMGGPMMGICQTSLDSSVIKGTSGLTLLKRSPVELSEERTCIKCGRCVDVCPMELYPLYYAFYGKRMELGNADGYNVQDCIECRSCEYICSAKLPLLSFIKREKEYARSTAKA
jgi:electron transport complex protein RnfC